MYTSHFRLHEMPFGLTPDTSYFFASRHAQSALNTLLVAARSGEGFIKITGEVGTGKTLLCRKFMACVGDAFVIAYIPNPSMAPRTLLLAVADELGLLFDSGAGHPVGAEVDQHRLLKALTARLLALAGEGRRVLLCLDEAQAMPLETLEAIRLLTNLETEKRKLLQVVLFGQPELDAHLAVPGIRQLAQRISFHYHLEPLQRADLAAYLAQRLRVAAAAGAADSSLFTAAAVSALYRASGGVPRLVNIVAHKALMLAYGLGRSTVELADVVGAARDTPGARPPRWSLAEVLVRLFTPRLQASRQRTARWSRHERH
ncbi:ExeA family protein [Massilia sp. PWRC2]|uniref:ExeA family protein n=1 Tax=Massilia sp. PWRC2 TaxID=2804626 RepID=UPI003CE6BB86